MRRPRNPVAPKTTTVRVSVKASQSRKHQYAPRRFADLKGASNGAGAACARLTLPLAGATRQGRNASPIYRSPPIPRQAPR
jgi:hypothetical protein